MKTVCISFNETYIEGIKVHHTLSDEEVERKVEEWSEANGYDLDSITWSFLNSDAQ